MAGSWLSKLNPLPFSRGEAQAWVRSLRSDIRIQFSPFQDALAIRLRRAWETRASATFHLLLEALNQVDTSHTRGLNVSIYCTDYPPPMLWLVTAFHRAVNILSFGQTPKHHILSYCKKDVDDTVISIPDFIFWNWPQVGISSFDQIATDIALAGLEEPIYPNLFWVGAASHPSRRVLLTLKDDHPLYDFREVIWDRSDPDHLSSNSYVPLIDHALFKYLLDVEGNGYSGRVKLLMFSRRPLFLQERPYLEYFYCDLKPFVHYIPVKHDFSDLAERLSWAENHPDQAHTIAAHAYEYAQKTFSTAIAIQQLAKVLLTLAS